LLLLSVQPPVAQQLKVGLGHSPELSKLQTVRGQNLPLKLEEILLKVNWHRLTLVLHVREGQSLSIIQSLSVTEHWLELHVWDWQSASLVQVVVCGNSQPPVKLPAAPSQIV
jgi:hypothetical protein